MTDPDRIFLQPVGSSEYPDGRTWCQDRIDEDPEHPDVEYIRLDLHEAECERLRHREKVRDWVAGDGYQPPHDPESNLDLITPPRSHSGIKSPSAGPGE